MLICLCLLAGTAASLCEAWTCPACGGESEGNFCPWCGALKPEVIACPSCGVNYDAEAGYAFCPACGAKLSVDVVCPGCGAVYAPDAGYVFCPACGENLQSGAAPAGGVDAGDSAFPGQGGLVTIASRNMASHMVGLKADGTVVTAGENNYGQCKVGEWTDIVAVAVGEGHTVGLKADGTVVAVGSNDCGVRNVGDLRDIKAVFAGHQLTAGLKMDGAIVTLPRDTLCDVRDWTGIRLP